MDWVTKGDPIEIICTGCRRIVLMPVDAIQRRAISPAETQQSFSLRLRCSECGSSGVQNCSARMSYWEGSRKDTFRG